MTSKKRLMVCVDDESYEKLMDLKKEKFYDKPWAELYRTVIELGADRCLNED